MTLPAVRHDLTSLPARDRGQQDDSHNDWTYETGSAQQYFIKDAGADFWRNVERKSVTAYRHMIDTADKYKPEGHEYPIQAWCAEMYVQQFETVRAGFTPVADERLRFHWANGKASEWDERAYFHNAGVVAENGHDFCKITWQSSPFHKQITVSPESASSRYVALIRRTEDMFPDLVWE